jgi:hypothetical protein
LRVRLDWARAVWQRKFDQAPADAAEREADALPGARFPK